ncbi:MAG TPA: hypothetical protein VEP94_01185 [Solirubrobacterales bacterium]|nr:hypothetical protein [Solirubrobacterales bacterium]
MARADLALQSLPGPDDQGQGDRGPAATSGKVGHKACDFLGLLVGALAISGYPWGGQLKQIEALAAGPCRFAEGSFDFWV